MNERRNGWRKNCVSRFYMRMQAGVWRTSGFYIIILHACCVLYSLFSIIFVLKGQELGPFFCFSFYCLCLCMLEG